MAINERLVHTASAVDSGATEAEQGLILHLDANDVDSYDGDGSVWYDISEHDVTIPLSDNADDLELHLNASDSASYGGSGTTWTDISGNSRNATIGGGFESTFDKDNGGYFHLDGSDSNEATVSHNTALDITSTGFTVEAWVNPDDTNYNTLVAKFSTSASIDGYSLAFNAGDIFWRLYTSGSGVGTCNYTTGSVATTNTWHHIVGTVSGTASGSTMKLYQNGTLLTTSTTTGTYVATTRDLKVGGYDYADSRNFDGKIGAVRIYSKALSASEIGQNYRHGRDYIYTDLVDDTDLELHLDPASYSGTGTTWTADAGNNGTLVGDTSYDQELGDFFDLDGSGDYISLNSGGYLTGDFTVEMWWNFDTLSDGYRMLLGGSGYSSGSGLGHYIENSRLRTWVSVNGSTSNVLNGSGTDLTTNKWQHVVLTRSGGTYTQYIDTNQVGQATGTTASLESTNSRIGGHYNATGFDINAKVGQVRIYSSALSQAQIRQNFNFTKNDYPNGSNATRIGATFSPSTTPNYWSFDGINDAMLLSTTSTLLGDTNNIKTISAFVTLSSTSARGHIYSVSASNNSNDFFYIGWFSDTNKVHITSRDGSSSNSFTHSAPLTAVANTWKHICITGGDGNTPKIYANGVELTVTSSTSGTATNASWINYPSYSGTVYTYVGKLRQYLPASTHWHSGRIGQVKLYDETLTSTEVLALFNAEKDTYGL